MTHKILIAAGGTGGHIFPGLAMADYFREQGWKIHWIGTIQGLESKLVPEQGYPIDLLPFAGLRGKGLLHLLRGFVGLWRSVMLARRIIRQQNPSLILSFGGYPSFPPALAGILLGKPLVLHEANAVAGLANRILAPLAKRVVAAFPESFGHSARSLDSTKWLTIGSPVRRSITMVAPPAERFAGRKGPLHLMILGGSLGARSLNTLIIEALRLTPAEQRPFLVHQTGRQHLAEVEAQYQNYQLTPWVMVVPFIDDMAKAYADCDLAICRSGALTIAELTVVGVASILVPLPNALADEQSANAEMLVQCGAAWHLPQRSLTPHGLAELWQTLSREVLLEKAGAARRLGSPQATEALARVCQALCCAAPLPVSKGTTP